MYLRSRLLKREVRPDEAPDDGLIDAFEARLKAERVGYSSVIEVSYSSSSPERAAQIANAVANTYIADQLNSKFDANRQATAWLQGRLRELDSKP